MKSKFRKWWDKACDWVRHTYWRAVPYDWRVSQVWYRFRCWAWRRHTTVKSRYLPHTWVDRTAVLPHTMFEILSQFVEGECSPGHVDWEASGHMVTVNGVEKNVRVEMQDLYDWWHQVYNKTYGEVNDILWEEVEKHPPVSNFIPINKDDEVVDEDEAELFLWEQEFKTPEDEEIHNHCMRSLNKLERMQEEKLQEMMHRLVNLMPYLWT